MNQCSRCKKQVVIISEIRIKITNVDSHDENWVHLRKLRAVQSLCADCQDEFVKAVMLSINNFMVSG